MMMCISLAGMMLYRSDRTGLLTCAALDAVVYVRAGGLPVHYLVNTRWTDFNAPADAGAKVVVHLDHYTQLLAFPLPDVDHGTPLDRLSSASD
jgi:hypothetical protein